MAYRCILDSRKECNGCGKCQEPENEEGLTSQQINDEKDEDKLYEKGLI